MDPFILVKRALTIQGSTYAAPRDYHNAVRTVEANHTKFPLVACVTHRFSLEDTEVRLKTVMEEEAVRGVIVPSISRISVMVPTF